MRTKLMSLETAAGMIRDGDRIVMSAGFTHSPMAMLREIARRDLRDLHIIGIVGGSINLDFLVGTGQTKTVECCSIGFEPFGRAAPNFDRYLKESRIYALDNTCGIAFSMIQAGSMGVPYIPVRGLAGTDVFKRRPDMLIAPNPFDPAEETVVALSTNPDVAILHALRADRDGNAMLRKHGEDVMVAQASRRVIVTAEEIVDRVTADDEGGQYISAINVTAVVHAPRGAHPTGVPGYYEADAEHIREYVRASTDDESFRAYLEKYVLGKTEAEYQELVKVGTREVVGAPR